MTRSSFILTTLIAAASNVALVGSRALDCWIPRIKLAFTVSQTSPGSETQVLFTSGQNQLLDSAWNHLDSNCWSFWNRRNQFCRWDGLNAKDPVLLSLITMLRLVGSCVPYVD